jgi:hypothetical protein
VEDFTVKDETLKDSLSSYSKAKAYEDELKKTYTEAKERRESLEESLYIALENSGFQSVNTEAGTFYRRVDQYFSVNKEVRDEAYAWLKTQNLESLIQPTVNARTLTATMKERQDQGLNVPKELINMITKNRVGIRK